MLTIPNLVSLLRLLAIPVFWWVLLAKDDVTLAGWLILVIGLTDWVDGYLARRLGQVSELGKALDPIADRLMIASALIGGLIVGVIPLWFGLLLIVRELAVAGMALYLASRGGGKIAVRREGKVATFLLYGAIPAFYVAASGDLPWLLVPLAWGMGLVGLALYLYVAVLYVGDTRARLAGLESPVGRQEG